MLNSKFFFFALLNVLLFCAHLWLYVEKAHPSSVPSEAITVAPQVQKTTPFHHLPFYSESYSPAPLTVTSSYQEAELIEQVAVLQQRLDRLQRQLTDTKRQSARQLIALKSENDSLYEQLAILDSRLLNSRQRLIAQQVVIDGHQSEEPLPLVRQTEREGFKASIDLLPDLIKHKADPLTADSPKSVAIVVSKQPDPFSGEAEFGFSYEQDNQVTKSFNGRLLLDYDKPDLYNINSDLDFEFEDEDGSMTTGRYRWQLQSDYNLDTTNLVYARSDISRSKFSSYKQEDIFTLGYGRIFFNNPKHKFNLEAGPGYRFAVPNVGEDAVSIDEFIVRTRVNYERVLNENLQVKMDAVLESGHSNSVYSVGFKAQNRIYQQLYLTFDFAYKFTENVPVDTVREEVSSGMSLLYAF